MSQKLYKSKRIPYKVIQVTCGKARKGVEIEERKREQKTLNKMIDVGPNI